MPRQQRVGAHNRYDLVEPPPGQSLGLGGQANALFVGDAQPPRSKLLSEHAVLLLEVVDQVALLLMDPAGQRHKQKPQRMRQRRHDAQVTKATGRASPQLGPDERGNLDQTGTSDAPIELLDTTRTRSAPRFSSASYPSRLH